MKMKFQKCVCGLLILIGLLACFGCGQKEGPDAETATTMTEEQATSEENQQVPEVEGTEAPEEEDIEGLTFPVMLDSGKLELSSVFEYGGINPDFEDVFAEGIGAIQLKNISGQYLKSAEIVVSLSDGETLSFLVEDVPAYMEVLAFETQNQVYDDTRKVVDVSVEAGYSVAGFEDLFSYNVNGSDITVENISGNIQNNIVLHYHCTIDGMCFGGKSYNLSLESLEAGASATVSDTACYMGDVTVTNIVAE